MAFSFEKSAVGAASASNANENDLQLGDGLAACGESRSRPNRAQDGDGVSR
jgi:hypothetical protein